MNNRIRFNRPTLTVLFPLVLVVFLAGCTMLVPRYLVDVKEIPVPPLPAPQSFEAVQSVVFSFHGRDMTGIGVLSMDRATRSFELSCMTPMGSKLFDLRMVNGTPEVLFALPFFAEKEGFGEAVALDISRIYFDQEPPHVEKVFRKGDALLFEIDLGKTAQEYQYEGDPLVLKKKRFCGGHGIEVQIEYVDFMEQEGFRCIREAKLKSRKYGYQLTVRTKELTIKDLK